MVFRTIFVVNFLMFISTKNDVCEPCHLAKEHKLPFTKSNYVSKHVFEIIYIDIWGLIKVPSIHTVTRSFLPL